MTDYYSLLGVNRENINANLKKSYRRLAKKYHPDINKEKNAEEKFKEIQKAYDVLGDPKKRKLYDKYGDNWDKIQNSNFSQEGRSQEFNFQDLGGMFGNFFSYGEPKNFGGNKPKINKGEDIEVSLRLNIEDAIKGGKHSISYNYEEKDMNNLTKIRKHKTINLNIPAAIGNGKKIRLKGKGCQVESLNSKAGDLYIKIKIIDHKNYKVNGNDVYQYINIAPWEAALGTNLEIETPYGQKKIKLLEGSQSGLKMRIKGKGLNNGDFYIVYNVKIPIADTNDKKEFYKKMKEKMNFDPRN